MRNYNYLTIPGSLILAFVLVLDALFESVLIPDWLLLVLVSSGTVLLCAGIVAYGRSRKSAADERFILHRLKSSRFGLFIGLAAIFVLVFYDMIVGDTVDWNLVIIVAAITAGKVGAMVYYRITG